VEQSCDNASRLHFLRYFCAHDATTCRGCEEGRGPLPPQSAWQARTQTVTVLGSTDGTTCTTVVGAQGYRFDPASGNTATVTLPGTSLRYLRLSVSATTGWPAGQFSEVEAYRTS
jgi:hypothetical protein